jgi:hypothetical protein
MAETTDKKVVKTSRMSFEEICAEHPTRKIVTGSLSWLEAEEKQAVRITCSTEWCGRERTVRTSDLWQVEHCEACTRKARREHARDRRKAKKAEAKVEVKAAEAATVAVAS